MTDTEKCKLTTTKSAQDHRVPTTLIAETELLRMPHFQVLAQKLYVMDIADHNLGS